MNYKKFKYYIDIITECSNNYNELIKYVNEDALDKMFKPCDALITFLSEHFEDKSDWISYWIFDLDFGKKYHEGCVMFDDKPVELSTIRDLYEILKSNKKSTNKIVVKDYVKLKDLILRNAEHDDSCMSVRGWGDGPCDCGALRSAKRNLTDLLIFPKIR